MRSKEQQSSHLIQISAQQSRFHTEAATDPTSKDIVIKSLSIAIGQKEILTNAELSLKEGRRYVLAGRNGVGKSTLLRAMADNLIPGIPPSIRILLLGQTQSSPTPRQQSLSDATAELSLTGTAGETQPRRDAVPASLLSYVVRSHSLRERLLHEETVLSSSLADTADLLAAVEAVRRISLDRLRRNVEEARRVAEKRSGARGSKARKELIRLEEELVTAEKVAGDNPGSNAEEVSSSHGKAVEMLEEVRMELESIDASSLPGQARKILIGLGFKEDAIDSPLSHLSGGWHTRASIACSLVQPADILLLDEPTNFLDLPSIIWLQQYLISLSEDKGTTILAVTHDRAFADAIGEELLVLRELSLERFRGTLSGYELQRYKYAKYMTRMKDALERQVSHMKDTIESNMKAAKKQGDDKKARQAASRKKKLEERTGMERSAKGTRFKLNRDLPGYHTSNRGEIEVPKFDPLPKMAVKTEVPDLRFPGALVSVEGASFHYPSKDRKTSAREILKDVNLTVRLGERVGIVGLNGSGKTTLINLIMGKYEGADKEMKPSKGTITRHPRAKFGRYSQRVTEELTALGEKNRELTALAHLIQVSNGLVDEGRGRRILGSLGLTGQTASDVPILALSGGQKVRLALAVLLFDPPHLLVLDEVTTHLDSDTIVALIQTLRSYEGALVVVSHDRFFVRTLVEGESLSSFSRSVANGTDDDEDNESSEDEEESKPGQVYRVTRGELKRIQGMLEYEGIAERAAERLAKKGATG